MNSGNPFYIEYNTVQGEESPCVPSEPIDQDTAQDTAHLLHPKLKLS